MDESEFKTKLSPQEYHILRENGTERPFSGKYNNHKEEGNYCCKGCAAVLFDSDTKFDSKTGWPSFYDAKEGAVRFVEDLGHGMKRVEVRCQNCDSHLGHVFEDGPADCGGQRYCINSFSFGF